MASLGEQEARIRAGVLLEEVGLPIRRAKRLSLTSSRVASANG